MAGKFAAFLLVLQVEFPDVKFPVDQVRLPIFPAIVLLTFPEPPIYCDLVVFAVLNGGNGLPMVDAESRAFRADSKPAVRAAGCRLPEGT